MRLIKTPNDLTFDAKYLMAVKILATGGSKQTAVGVWLTGEIGYIEAGLFDDRADAEIYYEKLIKEWSSYNDEDRVNDGKTAED